MGSNSLWSDYRLYPIEINITYFFANYCSKATLADKTLINLLPASKSGSSVYGDAKAADKIYENKPLHFKAFQGCIRHFPTTEDFEKEF